MITVVLFDLDNTLYPEFSFVVSGIKIVAAYLQRRYGVDAAGAESRLLQILEEQGRGKIFDRLLEELELADRVNAATLVFLYRTHMPTIRFYPDSEPALLRLRAAGLRLGLVTDGLASVQQRKIMALNLGSLLDVIICTDELGNGCGKPSRMPFELALTLLDAKPAESVYVADDDTKDFAGPHALEMQTVQVLRPNDRTLRTGIGLAASSARHRFGSLREVETYLLEGAK